MKNILIILIVLFITNCGKSSPMFNSDEVFVRLKIEVIEANELEFLLTFLRKDFKNHSISTYKLSVPHSVDEKELVINLYFTDKLNNQLEEKLFNFNV